MLFYGICFPFLTDTLLLSYMVDLWQTGLLLLSMSSFPIFLFFSLLFTEQFNISIRVFFAFLNLPTVAFLSDAFACCSARCLGRSVHIAEAVQ